MALTASESYERGFVVHTTLRCLVATTDLTGATKVAGFLRDPDGRLVVQRD